MPLELGRSLGEGNSNVLQHPCLEYSKDRGTWQATAHEVTNSRTRMSDIHFHFYFIIVKLFVVEKNEEII